MLIAEKLMLAVLAAIVLGWLFHKAMNLLERQ
jgi:hypothetical protein